jgi:hypothetical protein
MADNIDILQLPAGRELDDIIAESFFGYIRVWLQLRAERAPENMLIQAKDLGFYCSYFHAAEGWHEKGGASARGHRGLLH